MAFDGNFVNFIGKISTDNNIKCKIKMKGILFNSLRWIAAAGLMVLLAACGGKEGARDAKDRYLPKVSGKPGDVLVVVDRESWDSEAGNAIREILASDYPLLPQREPRFTLYNVPHNAFSGTFILHRNILRLNLDKTDSSGVRYLKDVWAGPQVVVEVNARNRDEAVSLLEENGQRIQDFMEQGERERSMQAARRFNDVSVQQEVIRRLGGSPCFPTGFSLKGLRDHFIWISQESTYVNQSILIYSYPVRNSEEFTLERLIASRDSVVRINVPGKREGSYMYTARSLSDPEMRWIRYGDRSFVEVRGLWELQNDFMGGPFILHAFPSRDQSRVIVLEGFVYAPKYDKRNYLRNVESMLYTFEWKN